MRPYVVRQGDFLSKLAHLLEFDAEAVWQWGYIERVSTGLLNLRDFAGDAHAMNFLEVASRSR
jgi:hypothetical protein